MLIYRGSPLSTIFGTWKKSYYAKFVLVESISTSTIFASKSPTCTILFFVDTPLFQAYYSCQSISHAPFPFPQLDQSPYKIVYNFIFLKLHRMFFKFLKSVFMQLLFHKVLHQFLQHHRIANTFLYKYFSWKCRCIKIRMLLHKGFHLIVLCVSSSVVVVG